ncbi:MAG: hypothetical protein J3R72DRAFT_474089 [Linnemannia gamsii]|nr:MAG: hypothetical protein J3R72DRAFT_474089 [Linnemannia gamsii]
MYNMFSDPRAAQNSRRRRAGGNDRQDFFPTFSNSLFFDPFAAQSQESAQAQTQAQHQLPGTGRKARRQRRRQRQAAEAAATSNQATSSHSEDEEMEQEPEQQEEDETMEDNQEEEEEEEPQPDPELVRKSQAELQEIRTSLDNLAHELQQIVSGVITNKKHILMTEENLTKAMLKIDSVESGGDTSIRKQRKELIGRAEQILEKVDEFKRRAKISVQRR